jgi:hypothetical protein
MKLPSWSATAAGAAIGLAAGPLGAAFGGGVGATIDVLRSRGAKAKAKAAAEAKAKAQAEIEAQAQAAADAKAQAAADAKAKADAAAQKLHDLTELAGIRKAAPPLTVHLSPILGIQLPGPQVLNPLAREYIIRSGTRATALAHSSVPIEAVYPRWKKTDAARMPLPLGLKTLTDLATAVKLQAQLDAIRKAAPPLILTRSGTGPFGIKLRTLNAMAHPYVIAKGAQASKLEKELTNYAPTPVEAVYPGGTGEVKSLAPDLVAHKKGFGYDYSEINPDAIMFVMMSGFNFADIYPDPPPWQSDWPGSKDTAIAYAKLVGRPFDGPGGVYVNWHHESGGINLSGVGDFVGNVVHTAGALAGTGLKMVDDVSGAIGGALGKIPIVGSAFEAYWDYSLTPLHVADDIAHGKSIDHAVLDNISRAMKDIHTLAPYIETVIAVVPGVGPVASGAIAAGLALASGEPIDQVMIDAAAASIPGGEIVKAVYHAGVAVMSGKGDAASLTVDALSQAAGAMGVPIPPEAEKVISAGVQATQDIANGKKPDQALIDAAVSQLPPVGQAAAKAAQAVASGKNVADVLLKYGPDMIKGVPASTITNLTGGLTTGMALGHGQALQALQSNAMAASIAKTASAGAQIVASSPIVGAAAQLNDEASKRGYDVGAMLAKHAVTRFQVIAQRKLLSPAEQIGYDMALGLHVARVVYPPPKKVTNPTEIAGYMITHGMRNAQPARSQAVLATVVKNPVAAKGVQLAEKKIDGYKKKTDWLHWVGVGFGGLVGGLTVGPAGAAAGVAMGGAVDAMRHAHKNKPVPHGIAAKHVGIDTGKAPQ